MRRLLSVVSLLVLLQPATFAQYANDIDAETLMPGSAGEPVSTSYPVVLPARGGQVDWGLALSGGGFRSAAFSIGVLKALYEKKLIDQIDAISTVSGGGYASYWMYTKSHDAPDKAFGAGAFDDSVFTTNVCNLARKSEFLPLRRMMGGLFSSDDDAFRKYREAIEFTFGADDTKTRDQKRNVGEEPLLPFTAFDQQIRDGKAPYFILNTTVAHDSLKKKDVGKIENIQRSFELSPFYRGSSLLGYSEWPNKTPNVKTWCGGVALSAAAIRFKLNRKMENYSAKIPKAKEIKMYDGGFSENLGALPLIQHRMKNIIIVDAENDAAYKFPSYRALRDYLGKQNIELRVREVEDFLKDGKKPFSTAAVSTGSIKYNDGGEDSKVYYIKMSRPTTIFTPEMQKNKTWPDGTSLPVAKRSKTRPSVCTADGLTPITRTSLYGGMVSYSRFLNEAWTWRYFFKVFPYINYNFPQLATVDQTYYNDQLEAFIALGYLEASELNYNSPN